MADIPIKNAFKLPAEVRSNMNALAPSIDQAIDAMDKLDRMGMDTTEMRQQLEYAKNIREILLNEFD